MPRERPHPGWTQNLLAAAAVRPGERVLIVADEPLIAHGSQLLAAVAADGASGHLALWEGVAAVDEGSCADVAVILAGRLDPVEAAERMALGRSVRGHGGRVLALAFIDGPLLDGELSQPAADLSTTAQQLLRKLVGAKRVRACGRSGTDIRLDVHDRKWITDSKTLGPGEYANYPNGEIYIAPHKTGADGIVVADLTVPYTVDGLVDEPVTLRFETGRVTSIEGGQAAEMLRQLVADAGAGADVIAELGIGFNPAIRPRGNVLLDEKAANTAHVAIGRNNAIHGGDNEASIHVDCVFSHPTIEVDGRLIELP